MADDPGSHAREAEFVGWDNAIATAFTLVHFDPTLRQIPLPSTATTIT
jgi:hypothetical protein